MTLTTAPVTTAPASTRATAILLAVEGVLIFVPLLVLGAAIGWPASLDDPASIALPRLLENETVVRLGYLVYLVYSVLFSPVAVWTTRTLTAGSTSALAQAAIAFAALSTLARAMGISRWLTTMPTLAESYAEASPTARESLAVQYDVLNQFAGGIGEMLGVSLFAVLWLCCTLVVARRSGAAPRWLVVAGWAAAPMLALPLVELLGVSIGAAVTVGGVAIQLWFLAAAVAVWRRA